MDRGVWRIRLRPGPLVVAFVLPAVVLFGIGIVSLAGLLKDPDIVGGRRSLALAGLTLATLGVPIWLVTMHVSVTISQRHLRARLWPLFRTSIPLPSITSVSRVAVEPLGSYGGVGVKGSRRDRLLGFVGQEGAEIRYVTDSGDERRLTLLTPRAAELVEALHQHVI